MNLWSVRIHRHRGTQNGEKLRDTQRIDPKHGVSKTQWSLARIREDTTNVTTSRNIKQQQRNPLGKALRKIREECGGQWQWRRV